MRAPATRERCPCRTDIHGRCELPIGHLPKHRNAVGDEFTVMDDPRPDYRAAAAKLLEWSVKYLEATRGTEFEEAAMVRAKYFRDAAEALVRASRVN